MENMKKVKLAVFGEILFDIFGDERKIGGAPFNFAAHASRLGADVDMISAVGCDELGKSALDIARGFGMDTENVATINIDTGYCRVTLRDGSPSYELVGGVAYDKIPMPEKIGKADAFCFGTLAQRGEVSRATLRELLAHRELYGEIFYDVNIRGNHWARGVVDESTSAATILKLSREEVVMMDTDVAYAPGREEDVCRALAAKYPNLRLIALTLDKDGSVVYDTKAERIYSSPKPSSKLVSAVGAGDSFSACFLVNYLCGAGIENSLLRATALSDYVVTQLGAVPDLPPELIERII